MRVKARAALNGFRRRHCAAMRTQRTTWLHREGLDPSVIMAPCRTQTPQCRSESPNFSLLNGTLKKLVILIENELLGVGSITLYS